MSTPTSASESVRAGAAHRAADISRADAVKLAADTRDRDMLAAARAGELAQVSPYLQAPDGVHGHWILSSSALVHGDTFRQVHVGIVIPSAFWSMKRPARHARFAVLSSHFVSGWRDVPAEHDLRVEHSGPYLDSACQHADVVLYRLRGVERDEGLWQFTRERVVADFFSHPRLTSTP